MQEVLTTAAEAGCDKFVFDTADRGVAEEWRGLARFSAMYATDDGRLTDEADKQVGATTQ